MLKEVKWPGYVVGQNDDILDSGGCGPCTAIAIVDRGFRSAVLGHFVHPKCDEAILNEMLEAARTTIPEVEEALVRVAGASPELDEIWGKGESLRMRGYILRKLNDFGFSAAKIAESWNERSDKFRAIVVDLGAKQLVVENEE